MVTAVRRFRRRCAFRFVVVKNDASTDLLLSQEVLHDTVSSAGAAVLRRHNAVAKYRDGGVFPAQAVPDAERPVDVAFHVDLAQPEMGTIIRCSAARQGCVLSCNSCTGIQKRCINQRASLGSTSNSITDSTLASLFTEASSSPIAIPTSDNAVLPYVCTTQFMFQYSSSFFYRSRLPWSIYAAWSLYDRMQTYNAHKRCSLTPAHGWPSTLSEEEN